MASAYSIAARANRSLTVIWQRNEDCMSSYTDLYTSPSGINVVDWDELSDDVTFTSSVRRAIRSIAAKKGLMVGEGYPRNFIYGIDDNSKSIVTVLWTRGTHAPPETDCTGYLADKVQFYQHLHPAPAVDQLVQSVEFRRGSNGLVGVHIRAFDERYDWPVVSPSLTQTGAGMTAAAAAATGDSEARTKLTADLRSKRFDQAASLDSFVALMTALITSQPDVRFFVASNSVQAKNRIVRHFGAARVLTLDANAQLGERESAHSIVVAAAEFYLLGMTDFVVHTRGSSFAREAAARTGISVIDVSMEVASLDSRLVDPEGEQHDAGTLSGGVRAPETAVRPLFFLSQHATREGSSQPPLCAMPEFIRAAYTFRRPTAAGTTSEEGAEGLGAEPLVCYVEAGREMCTVAYSVCPCASTTPPLFAGLYGELHCYVPDGELSNRTDCVRLLAESNGYTMTR